MAETIVLPLLRPARCHTIVAAKTVYSNLSHCTSEWASQPIEVAPEVRLARTIVKDQPENVLLNVVNTNDYNVRLSQGLSLGRLEEVEPVPHDSSETTNGISDNEDTSHINQIIDRVDNSVTLTDKERLKSLLLHHGGAFSRNEYDIGRATAVKHRIDTADNRPVRQSLRRQQLFGSY
jgi:hypothetical protein